jgi:hypothetical protein
MRHVQLWVWVTSIFVWGCVIEERKIDAELVAAHEREQNENDESGETEAGPGGDSPQCVKYCERALENCTGENAIYASVDTCLGICKLLPLEPGDDEDLNESNTVACRSEQARLAGQTGEPKVHCPTAGPGGSPPGRGDGCGNNCESYCMFQPLLCGDSEELVLEQAECERRCAALPDRGEFDVEADHDANNVQCRLVHLSSATLGAVAAEDHCWHSSITPREGSPCGIPVDEVPDCEQYCEVVSRACTGELAVYEDKAHCESACELFDVGLSTDRIEDTLGCRLYHSYASLEAPDNHCPHAGPSGDGHCGADNCESYCALAETACPGPWADAGLTLEQCMTTCSEVDGAERDSGYVSEAAHSGNTIQCRIYHATLAKDDPDACDAVFGAAPCDD